MGPLGCASRVPSGHGARVETLAHRGKLPKWWDTARRGDTLGPLVRHQVPSSSTAGLPAEPPCDKLARSAAQSANPYADACFAFHASRAACCCFLLSFFRWSSQMKPNRGPFDRFRQPATRHRISSLRPAVLLRAAGDPRLCAHLRREKRLSLGRHRSLPVATQRASPPRRPSAPAPSRTSHHRAPALAAQELPPVPLG